MNDQLNDCLPKFHVWKILPTFSPLTLKIWWLWVRPYLMLTQNSTFLFIF